MREGFPDESGEAAEQGDAAHWVGACMITGRDYHLVAPNGVVITPEIIDSATVYANHVRSWGIHVWVEVPLHMPDIHEECGGTADVTGYDYAQNLIRVADFKHGFGIVEVFENWQLLCYLSGMVTKLQGMGIDLRCTEVELSVIQPRAGHRDGRIRTWRFKLENAGDYIDQLREAAHRAMSETPVATTGAQCRQCSARHACEAVTKSGYIAVDISQEPHKINLTTWEASNELVQIEEALNILESRRSGLAAQVERAVAVGERAPFHMIERGKKREVWREDMKQQVIIAGQLLGKDLSKPVEPITPAQARKLFVDESVIKAYSFTPTGENKLVRLNTAQMRKLFGETRI